MILATCATIAAVLMAAKPGEEIRLSGQCGDIVIPRRDNPQPITIDASRATVRSLNIQGASGWVWRGGTIDSPLPPAVWRNVMIDNAHRIEIRGVTLRGGHTGVVVTRGSSDVMLRDNIATGLQSDGFNVATATRVSLIGNSCIDFHPILPVYDGAKLVKDNTHPDCIMIWSEKGQLPTSDITIVGNTMVGAMQGITAFWHPELDRPKVERVKVWDNTVDVSYWHGIFLMDTTGADVRRNKVRTVKGARSVAYPYQPVTAWLKADPDAWVCGNEVNGRRDRKC